jgi:hypothetical protein
MLPVLLAGMIIGKLLFRGAPLDASILLGCMLGTCGYWASYRLASDHRCILVIGTLLAAQTAEALSPFVLRDAPAAISWLPFAALLEGSMMTNFQGLFGRLVLYASILQMFRLTGAQVGVASVGLAFWVLITELLQTVIESRSADLTEPLLVVLLGQVLKVLPLAAPKIAKPGPPSRRRARSIVRAVRACRGWRCW